MHIFYRFFFIYSYRKNFLFNSNFSDYFFSKVSYILYSKYISIFSPGWRGAQPHLASLWLRSWETKWLQMLWQHVLELSNYSKSSATYTHHSNPCHGIQNIEQIVIYWCRSISTIVKFKLILLLESTKHNNLQLSVA